MLTANQNDYYTADATTTTTTTTKRTTKPTPKTVILANENNIINTQTNNNDVVVVVDNRCPKDKNLNALYSTTLTTTTTTAVNKARAVMSHNHRVAVTMHEEEEEQEQEAPEQLDDDNENYVIDIGTMQIADDSNHIAMTTAFNTDSNSSDSYNKYNNVRQGAPEEDEAKQIKESAVAAEIETSEKGEELGINESTNLQNKARTKCDNVETETETDAEAEVKTKEELDQNYLNEFEISKVDEEQIISELVDVSGQGTCAEAKQSNGVRVAFGIILRLMLPLANGVMRGFKGIRDARFLRVLKSVASSRQSLANLMAFAANTISLNLSSVQVSQRIEPILKLLKIRHTRDGVESLPDTPAIENTPCFPTTDVTPTPPPTPTKPDTLNMPFMPTETSGVMPTFSTGKRKPTAPQTPAPKCCTLNVLAEPPPGQPILADIIFIHGLHGSQVNTWRQGLWENERQPEQFERPPKPPVRPPKRPKHTRTAPLHPPHKQKRARFAKCESSQRASVDAMGYDEMKDLDDVFYDATEQELKNSASYACGPPQDIQNCDGIEYSFPTFRLRLNDNGRQLQGATDKMDESFASGVTGEPHRSSAESTEGSSIKPKTATAKPSADDPNYSKCWPGDWLPLDCPGVRVIALNYTTDPYLWRPLWKKKEPRSNLIERAREMTELLVKHRVGCGRPIVWVGHSKGGLFIKQIMVDAWESGRPAVAPLWRSSRGVFFYSVPHRGSHLACIKAPLLARSVEMLDIEKNNKYLLDLHRRFAGLYHLGHIKIEVFSFVETALTLMSVLYLRIVGVDSADPGFGDVCGIRLDHREICKPRSRECILYKELVKMIKKVC